LGLTQREAQVLAWIAKGKGNYESGVILGAKPRTICKHVEHILSKLNVENRTAAAAIAFAVCSQLLDLF
jgi:DNA-binding CsgD family transcriptional regulator